MYVLCKRLGNSYTFVVISPYSTVMHQVIANLIRVFLEGVAALPGAGIPDLYCFVTRPASVSIAL